MSNSGDLLLTEIFYLLFPVFLMLVTILVVSYYRIKRLHRVMHRYRSKKLEELESERKRIANDLHDFVASKLLKIKVELNESLESAKDPIIFKNLTQGIQDLNKFHDELRYLVEFIYPKELLSGNIKTAFQRLAEDMSNSHTEIIMDIEFDNPLPPDKLHQLYRLLQEKITNIIVYENPPSIIIGLFENSEEREVLLNLSYNFNPNNNRNNNNANIRKSGRGSSIIPERLKTLKAKSQITKTETAHKESIIFPI